MPYGDLEVVCGPMFAGKTSRLIARINEWYSWDHTVGILKPEIDTRYSAEPRINAHNGDWLPADVIRWFGIGTPEPPYLAIDEAQFLTDAQAREILGLLKLGKHIVVAGLDLNSSGEPFGPMPLFLAHADVVTKLRGTCAKCGEPSTRSQNLTPNTAEILVGGPESYEPRCALCFTPTPPLSLIHI